MQLKILGQSGNSREHVPVGTAMRPGSEGGGGTGGVVVGSIDGPHEAML